MTENPDRLYDLVPVVYRQRDADQGYPLRALLRVIAEQVSVVERDITGLYENWFIETCQDSVVPYIGDLVGYTAVSTLTDPRRPSAPWRASASRCRAARWRIPSASAGARALWLCCRVWPKR